MKHVKVWWDNKNGYLAEEVEYGTSSAGKRGFIFLFSNAAEQSEDIMNGNSGSWVAPASDFAHKSINPIRRLVDTMKLVPNKDKDKIVLTIEKPNSNGGLSDVVPAAEEKTPTRRKKRGEGNQRPIDSPHRSILPSTDNSNTIRMNK
ncbi:Hypothetical predicted protein [Octopus vulgaris]|uniref:Uncharacterized protein n=1 Tax=Octopus vulgaris TaxID=6645 RepID=A0AA36C2X1_OCTVU|nr:Hypothetical predicted protein [Octopus vulgaris]